MSLKQMKKEKEPIYATWFKTEPHTSIAGVPIATVGLKWDALPLELYDFEDVVKEPHEVKDAPPV